MKFKSILKDYSLGVDDPEYESYGRIIPGLAIGDDVILNDSRHGIIQDFPKPYYANIKIDNEIKLTHLSKIDGKI